MYDSKTLNKAGYKPRKVKTCQTLDLKSRHCIHFSLRKWSTKKKKLTWYYHTSVQANWSDSWGILPRRSWVWQPPSLFPLLVPQCMSHEAITSWRPSDLTVSLCACSVTQGCCLLIPPAHKHVSEPCRSNNFRTLLSQSLPFFKQHGEK